MRNGGEQPIVVGMRGQSGAIRRVGSNGMTGPQFDVADAQPIPRQLLARHVRQPLHGGERGVQQASRLVGLPLNLRPPRQAWRHRGIAQRGMHVRERDARGIVLAHLHLNVAEHGAQRGVVRIGVARGDSERQCFVESVLREQRGHEHLRRRAIALPAIPDRAASGLLGQYRVSRIARFASARKVQGTQVREVERTGWITSRALDEVENIEFANFRV